MTSLSRLLLVLAGLIGAAGVAAASAAAHGESRNLGAIATIFLAHGPALLAVALAGRGRLLSAAGAVLSLGTILFGADLAMREWGGGALFPGAAPLGGLAMLLGWLGMAATALVGKVGH